MDGSDPRIRGAYQRRANAINKCYQVARERKMVLFAIQHGGWCAAAPNFKGYQKYGRSNRCRNGKGGPWANDVYRITNPIRPALPKGRYIKKMDEIDPLRLGPFSEDPFYDGTISVTAPHVISMHNFGATACGRKSNDHIALLTPSFRP